MADWSQLATRVTRIDITDFEGGRHVGAGYQIVVDGRVIHDHGGLTLHGPAGERDLPADLAAAVALLWEHAERAVAELENLSPAGSPGRQGSEQVGDAER